MASISRFNNGTRAIQFVAADGHRRTIRLGKVTQRQADSAKRFVEDLLACRITGASPRPATSEWITSLPEAIHERLARVGLVDAREAATTPTLAEWTRTYIDSRTDVKPRTRINFEQARSNLVGFFGESRKLADIDPADAADFRVHLLTRKRLAEGTVRRRCKRAKQFFAAAIKRKLLSDNPFDDIPCGHYAADRFHYVNRDDAQRILNACPDAQWRLIFALARFGGLRVPSEILPLKWGHVDWERSQFKVISRKTEHHAGGGTRRVPIFPELLVHLRDAFEAAEPGTEHVITRYRDSSVNLRTQLGRIVARAGLELWPKPFVNLRSSRETELVEQFPLHVVTAWLGNSPDVAKRHYLQVTDEHFRRATAPADQPDHKALQNALQYGAESGRTDSQSIRRDSEKPRSCGHKRRHATQCHLIGTGQLPPRGLEWTPPSQNQHWRCRQVGHEIRFWRAFWRARFEVSLAWRGLSLAAADPLATVAGWGRSPPHSALVCLLRLSRE